MKRDATAMRQKILEAVLSQVPFDGWTESALTAGLEQAGLKRGAADLLFPQGIRDVIEFLGVAADEAMQRHLADEPGFARQRVRDKIAMAVRARLTFLMPHREAVRRMLTWYALPFHVPLGIRRLYRTVDLIWRAAGDTSTDFNFYTKRILLAGVIKTTMMFWLDDETPNGEASWLFLDRRIGEVLKFGKSISLLKEWTPSEWVEMAKSRIKKSAI